MLNMSVSDMWVLYTCRDPHFIAMVQQAKRHTHEVIMEARGHG
jgi:hypothetical protein